MESETAKPLIPRIAYSVAECAELLGCSRQYVYDQVNSGALRSIKVIGRRFIPAAALSEFLGNAPA